MQLYFTNFQSRLLVLLLVPLLAIVATVYVAVERANTDNALAVIRNDLRIAAANFTATIADRNENLAIAGDALSSDYAFRQAFTTDRATRLSAMENLLGRLVTADFIALNKPGDGLLLADTHRPALENVSSEWQALIEEAEALDRKGEYPEANDTVLIDGKPFHMTILPLLTPDLSAWVSLGFEVGSRFTESFRKTVNADITVLVRNTGETWQVSGSSLPAALAAELATRYDSSEGELPALQLGADDYISQAQALDSQKQVMLVLQRSLTEQLAPFKALQQRMLKIFALGVSLLLLVLLLLARTVTRPLQLLTAAARRIRGGDYRQEVTIPHRDEIGELAGAFNAMAVGLAEKERVRDLLGKVVSPEIANELLSRQLELGGEEREVTVMFTDVRGFTALCEGQAPAAILALLNEYFTMLANVIESQHGVVDKYIGDAVMALFGAPLVDSKAATNAVRAALAVKPALAALNDAFSQRGLKPIAMGIGINSDRVVVGNMGSQSRLNYTAIGDGVNLASRVEGLCKRYGVDIIVTDSTCEAAPDFLYLPLDRVQVKGKQESIGIHTPLLPLHDASELQKQAVNAFCNFLQHWQQGQWLAASTALDAFAMHAAGNALLPAGLIALYRQRLQGMLANPPAQWDGVFRFDEK